MVNLNDVEKWRVVAECAFRYASEGRKFKHGAVEELENVNVEL